MFWIFNWSFGIDGKYDVTITQPRDRRGLFQIVGSWCFYDKNRLQVRGLLNDAGCNISPKKSLYESNGRKSALKRLPLRISVQNGWRPRKVSFHWMFHSAISIQNNTWNSPITETRLLFLKCNKINGNGLLKYQIYMKHFVKTF